MLLCAHVGVATLTVRELFEFAVDPVITEDTLDAALDRLMEVAIRYVLVSVLTCVCSVCACVCVRVCVRAMDVCLCVTCL